MAGDGFDSGFAGLAIADDGGAGGPKEGACRRCGEGEAKLLLLVTIRADWLQPEGHFARDCEQVRFASIPSPLIDSDTSQPAKLGACFNCVSVDYLLIINSMTELQIRVKRDTTKQIVQSLASHLGHAVSATTKDKSLLLSFFSMLTCHTHQAADCESRVCKNCAGVGHDALGCKQRRMLRMQHIADKVPAEAWEALEEASANREISDFKDAVQVLVKACPDMTYPQLEKEFRKRNFNVYLIALVSLSGTIQV